MGDLKEKMDSLLAALPGMAIRKIQRIKIISL